jgi:DNA-binding IclR family transcriptional regulator
MSHQQALGVVERCARETMPPLRLRVLADVADHPGSATSDVVKGLQLPRKTVDGILQELHLLELLTVDEAKWGGHTRWIYSLAEDVSRSALQRVAGNVSTPAEAAQ